MTTALAVRTDTWHVVFHPARPCFTAFRDPAQAQALADRLIMAWGKPVRPALSDGLPTT